MNNTFGESKKDRVFRMVARGTDLSPEKIAVYYLSLYREELKVSTAKAYRNEFLKLARENIEINETQGLRSYAPYYFPFWAKLAIAGLLTGAIVNILL